MSKNLSWRGITIAILIIFALIYTIPSLPGGAPKWWGNLLPQKKVHLGLDLQGGMHLVLEVQVEKAVENDLESSIEDIKEELRSEKIRYKDLKRDGVKGIDITIIRKEQESDFRDIIKSRFSDFDLSQGASDENGVKFQLNLTEKARNETIKMADDQALETISNRIDQFGVTEADIRPMEDNRIQIQLPGIKDPDRAKELIQKAAVLEFKLVDDENSLSDAQKGNMPPGDEILEEVAHNRGGGKSYILLKKRTLLTGKYITDARVGFDQYNNPYISFSFNRQGARIFERITEENLHKRLAIVIDNKVISAPEIQSKIGANGQITGSFTTEEASELAIELRSGSLPAPVHPIEERTVGPSLGKDSINKGFFSMVIGTVIVILFMVVYYGFSGLIADIALILNVVFIMAGLAFFEATLTLPGIAGIILTIGMSVDANVLIFERIREELKLGKTARTAIETGFSKAVVTILDANVTTFIAALVLFQFGTGPIKGFAVTLSIGITASFVTAVFIARFIFDYLYTHLNWKKISI